MKLTSYIKYFMVLAVFITASTVFAQAPSIPTTYFPSSNNISTQPNLVFENVSSAETYIIRLIQSGAIVIVGDMSINRDDYCALSLCSVPLDEILDVELDYDVHWYYVRSCTALNGCSAYSSAHVFDVKTTVYRPLLPGVYGFSDLLNPYSYISGWSISTVVDRDGLVSTTNGANIGFFPSSDVDGLLMQFNGVANTAEFEICINATFCESFEDRTVTGIRSVLYDIPTNGEWVDITKLDTTQLSLYMLQLIPHVYAPPFEPTATPNPAIITGTISGVSGTYSTEFHYTVTAGDVAISSALLFLFFSLFVAVIAGLLFSDVR